MEKIIPITYEDKHGSAQFGDAIIEYCWVEDQGILSTEIINIFLPDGISLDQHKRCKEQAANNFYLGGMI